MKVGFSSCAKTCGRIICNIYAKGEGGGREGQLVRVCVLIELSTFLSILFLYTTRRKLEARDRKKCQVTKEGRGERAKRLNRPITEWIWLEERVRGE